jgi:hypothetical protein
VPLWPRMPCLEGEVKYVDELIPMVGYGCHLVSTVLHEVSVKLTDVGDMHTSPGLWYDSANGDGMQIWQDVDLEWVAPKTCEAVRKARRWIGW